MYELMVLGQLMLAPRHGYIIAKIIGDVIGPHKRLPWGALYPLLARLERDGLVTAVPDESCSDGRVRKVYAITDPGRERFYALMLETQRLLAEYDLVFHTKVCYFHFLEPQQRLMLLRHYAVYAQQVIDFTRSERADLIANHSETVRQSLSYIVSAMEQKVRRWQLELRWAEECMERETGQTSEH